MIKELRKRTKMTQKDFAEYFNIPVRTLQDWEHGRRNPADYLVELIKYKVERELLGMLDFGEFKLRDTEDYEVIYIATSDYHIITTKDQEDLRDYKVIGKLKVYHDGTYFGPPDEMDDWVEDQAIDHLIEKGNLVCIGENDWGDKFWKLKA